MIRQVFFGFLVLYLVGAAVWLAAGGIVREQSSTELLNVACDPTRELWRDVNEQFIDLYEKERGERLTIRMSHGGSASQARSVMDGLPADVITLGLWSDTSAVSRAGLVESDWNTRLPYGALPYYSTIVFVVRKGNPKQVHDWPDLLKPGVQVVTPNPKTSGNGKLSFLAGWGAILKQKGSEAEALQYITELYQRVPVLDTGARGSTTTFGKAKIGDVHLTWENEAFLEVQEYKGELEIVYPPMSIRAEPPVAVVDTNVRRKGTKPAAEAYMKFLYTEQGQDIAAKHRYRPSNPEAMKRHLDKFPQITLFPITDIAPGWDEANERFFKEGAIFDQIYSRPRP
jgi:sulfate/thiosulfate-binding protein